MDKQVIENITCAVNTIKTKEQEQSPIPDGEQWVCLKEDFKRSILFQLQSDNYDRNTVNKAISYSFKLKKPFDTMFTDSLFKKLVDETFGWTKYWQYDAKSAKIYIDPRRAVESFKVLYHELSKDKENEDTIKEYEKLCKQSDLKALVLLPDDPNEPDEDPPESLIKHIDEFHDDCVFHTDDIGERCSIDSKYVYLLFYAYVNFKTNGEFPYLSKRTTISLLDKKLTKYSHSHGNVKKIIPHQGYNQYINIQIKIQEPGWYPSIKRHKRRADDLEPNNVSSDSVSDRLKRKAN